MKNCILLLSLLLCACESFAANDKAVSAPKAQQEDFYQLFSLLIKAPIAETTFTTADGTLKYDELKAFKLLDELYAKYAKPEVTDKRYSSHQLKVIAFFSHLADQHNNAALNEYLASDLLPIYKTNPGRFLSVLAELPYLVPSNCDRINAYFGFEGEHLNEKSEFLETHTPKIKKSLGPALAEVCLSKF